MSRKRFVYFLGIGLALVACASSLVVLMGAPVGAAVWDGRYGYGRNTGYFSNDMRYVLVGGAANRQWAANNHVLSNGIPSSVYTAPVSERVDRLVDFLKATNRSGSAQNKTGSAFIAHTIIGRTGDQANANGGTSVSDADFESVRNRLKSASANWNSLICPGYWDNTGAGGLSVDGGAWGSMNPSSHDIIRDFSSSCYENGVTFTDHRGGTYQLIYSCANPVGDAIGLAEFNFDLSPTITGSPSTHEGTDTPVALNPTVSNSGLTNSSSVGWQLTRFTLPPSTAIPGGATNAQSPEAYYGNGATNIAGGNRAFARGANALTVTPQPVGDYPVGTKVCFALSVRPVTHTNSNWRHSIPFCVLIVKKPKVNVMGGDLLVGRGAGVTSSVNASFSRKAVGGEQRTYGSWSEYAVIASGQVQGMASGAGYSGGALGTAFCEVSVLTFSNASTSGCSAGTNMGSYLINQGAPNVASRFDAAYQELGNDATINLSVLSSGVYRAQGQLSVAASNPISAGQWVVLNAPNATVTITGNIAYTGAALTLMSEIPQVIIIANNIIIADSVTNIDAWLLAVGSGANGRLNTCGTGMGVTESSALTHEQCSNKLTVNGPVVANHLHLRRTAGSGIGPESGDPAEVFNLRPDAYLWATEYNLGLGRLPTVADKELPPRF